MPKITSVTVHYSDAQEFAQATNQPAQQMPLEDFERLCAQAAVRHPPGTGYLKTEVTVNFDNGAHYRCRIDLCHAEHGFRDHARAVIEFIDTARFHAMRLDSQQDYRELARFLETIDWSA